MRRFVWTVLAVLCLPAIGLAHDSPMDHLRRELRMWVEDGNLQLQYRLQLSERSAMLQLHAMDRNGDGNITLPERQRFFTAFSRRLASLLRLTVAGRPLALAPVGEVRSDPRFGQTYEFAASLADVKAGRHAGRLADLYSRRYPGAFYYYPRLRGGVGVVEKPKATGFGQHPGMIVLKFTVDVPPARSGTTRPAARGPWPAWLVLALAGVFAALPLTRAGAWRTCGPGTPPSPFG